MTAIRAVQCSLGHICVEFQSRLLFPMINTFTSRDKRLLNQYARIYTHARARAQLIQSPQVTIVVRGGSEKPVRLYSGNTPTYKSNSRVSLCPSKRCGIRGAEGRHSLSTITFVLLLLAVIAVIIKCYNIKVAERSNTLCPSNIIFAFARRKREREKKKRS